MTNGDEYAYPNTIDEQTNAPVLIIGGLTKREYMATAILQGLMANPERYKYVVSKMSPERGDKAWSHEDATRHNAEKAVYLADALIEALNQDGGRKNA